MNTLNEEFFDLGSLGFDGSDTEDRSGSESDPGIETSDLQQSGDSLHEYVWKYLSERLKHRRNLMMQKLILKYEEPCRNLSEGIDLSETNIRDMDATPPGGHIVGIPECGLTSKDCRFYRFLYESNLKKLTDTDFDEEDESVILGVSQSFLNGEASVTNDTLNQTDNRSRNASAKPLPYKGFSDRKHTQIQMINRHSWVEKTFLPPETHSFDINVPLNQNVRSLRKRQHDQSMNESFLFQKFYRPNKEKRMKVTTGCKKSKRRVPIILSSHDSYPSRGAFVKSKRRGSSTPKKELPKLPGVDANSVVSYFQSDPEMKAGVDAKRHDQSMNESFLFKKFYRSNKEKRMKVTTGCKKSKRRVPITLSSHDSYPSRGAFVKSKRRGSSTPKKQLTKLPGVDANSVGSYFQSDPEVKTGVDAKRLPMECSNDRFNTVTAISEPELLQNYTNPLGFGKEVPLAKTTEQRNSTPKTKVLEKSYSFESRSVFLTLQAEELVKCTKRRRSISETKIYFQNNSELKSGVTPSNEHLISNIEGNVNAAHSTCVRRLLRSNTRHSVECYKERVFVKTGRRRNSTSNANCVNGYACFGSNSKFLLNGESLVSTKDRNWDPQTKQCVRNDAVMKGGACVNGPAFRLVESPW